MLARLPRWLRPLQAAEVRMLMREGRRRREETFLSMLDNSVFARPDTPYAVLFRAADIDRADLEKSLRADGLDHTLGRLLAAGVYLTLDEFKGRRPIERDGLTLETSSADFDIPTSMPSLSVHTGGSSGQRQAVSIALDEWETESLGAFQAMREFEVLDRPKAVWRPFYPGGLGFVKLYDLTRAHAAPRAWFSQVPVAWSREAMPYHGFWWYFAAAGLVQGQRLPFPRHVPLSDARRVANWLAATKRAGQPGYLDTNVSCGVRVCRAAAEADLDIAGSFLRLGSEPYTAARAAIIEAAGCRAACAYAMSEAGTIGIPCADPIACDDVHVRADKVAVIHGAGAGSRDADALYVTAFQPHAPKLLINLQTGDVGHLERRGCGCEVAGWGFDLHVHTIRSTDKLTTEGMHVLSADVHRLVEEVLPRAFGGAAGDYQLLEQEIGGVTTVFVVVSPSVGPVDDAAVVETALGFLREQGQGERMMAGIFRDADALRVVRRVPVSTPAAKVKPVHRESGEQA